MNKKKIAFITSHPAPYMDIIFNQLSLEYDLGIYYNQHKSKEKSWKKQNYREGKVLDNYIECLIGFEKILKSDFVIVGGWAYKFNIILIFLLILFQKKFAVTSDVPQVSRINSLKQFVKTKVLSFIPYFFLTGESCKEHYKKYYKVDENKIRIFPYGVKLADKNKMIKLNLNRKNKLENDKIKLLIANRFIQRKGYDVVLDCFKSLKENQMLNSFDIRIVGNGKEYEKYKKLFDSVSEDIKLLGWVELDEYEKLMDNCDIYIHASLFEPYGIPVIDAMSRGKLVIASTGVMAAVDFIDNGFNGFVYDSLSSDELYAILKNLLKHTDSIYDIGQNAINSNFLIFKNYNETLKSII